MTTIVASNTRSGDSREYYAGANFFRVWRDRQDRVLPVANIARIMKRLLPPSEKIAKDAKETVQECISEFICFVTSEASDRCQTEKRKTINGKSRLYLSKLTWAGDDIVWAMGQLEFDEYVNPLRAYLTKYRQTTKTDSSERNLISERDDRPLAGLLVDEANLQLPNRGVLQEEDHMLERQFVELIGSDDHILSSNVYDNQ
mmetsp:Transcript_4040/g.11894  ORF Transcript_4040/g.11894 Transcript_4040/m.11894 type:complete len:201 (-) Transcript_4040:6-608(-)